MYHSRPAVLVVDDEVSVLRSLTASLAKYGLDVQVAQSGSEGIERFKEHRSSIVLILVDIVMPGMLGTEMAREILRIDPAAKIIFMSGFPQADYEATTKTRFPFIEKPILAHDLLFKIEAALGPVMGLTYKTQSAGGVSET